MDYRHERYVRVYTRDTATMKLIGQDGRQVLFELFRKVDRCGFLDFGEEGPVLAVAAVCDLSVDRVESGLPKLLERGTVVVRENDLFIPNFLDAQETPQSDAQRQREARAKKRDLAKHGVTKRDGTDTKRDGKKQGDEDPKRHETGQGGHETGQGGHETGRNRHSVPSRTVPTRTDSSNLQGTAKALTGSARNGTPPEPQQPEKPPPSLPAKIPCPVDLWERMPEPTKKTLDGMLIPRDAQEYLCRGFAARYAGRADDLRREDHWVAGAVRAIQADWHDPSKRPKTTTAPVESGVAPAAATTEYKGKYPGRSFA